MRARRRIRDLRRLGDVARLLAQRAELTARRDAQQLADARTAADAADDQLLRAESALHARAAAGCSIDPTLWSFDAVRADRARMHVREARLTVNDAAGAAERSQAAWLAGQKRDEMIDARGRDALRLHRRSQDDHARESPIARQGRGR